MICDLCGKDEAIVKQVTRSFGKKMDLLIIEDIPVVWCSSCGESYMTAETLHEIERIKMHRHSFAEKRPVEVTSLPLAVSVQVTDDALSVDLSDGRTIFVPLGWYPRLEYATPEERKKWRLIGNGHGIHWEDIDEDISVEGLIFGKP